MSYFSFGFKAFENVITHIAASTYVNARKEIMLIHDKLQCRLQWKWVTPQGPETRLVFKLPKNYDGVAATSAG